MSTTTKDQAPRTWLLVVSAILSCFLLLAGLALALFGAASYNDSYSHDVDRAWGIASLVTGGILFAACCFALLFLRVRSAVVWYLTVTSHGLTLAGLTFVIVEGFQIMADAKRRGGDWGALAVLGSFIFGIAIPGIITLMALSNGYLLFRLPRQRASVRDEG